VVAGFQSCTAHHFPNANPEALRTVSEMVPLLLDQACSDQVFAPVLYSGG